jgi:nucleoid DNA-binding protein
MAASTRLTLDDLVDEVRKEDYLSFIGKKDATNILKAAFKAIKNVVDEDTDLRIHDFGIFSIKERAARTGRNPQTGEAVAIPAKQVLSFKPSKSAK